MDPSRPDPSWLPLRTGVLRFQHNRWDPDLTPEELVQALCNQACEGTNLKVDYDEDAGQIFDVRLPINDGYPLQVASFRIGDREPAACSYSEGLVDENRALILKVFAALHDRLEAM